MELEGRVESDRIDRWGFLEWVDISLVVNMVGGSCMIVKGAHSLLLSIIQ